ncbi:MAG TPA: alpha-glucan family phosphorylase [Bryobacteraceae bacterium]|nr:alpha-glucan family phosphorylase [Bryobacteraceae bacterium]
MNPVDTANPLDARVGYFSMEIALEPDIPTYSGGLGILAGDMLRSAADRGLATAAISLVHRGGYFRQILDENGNQQESSASWNPAEHLERVRGTASVTIDGRHVHVYAWRYWIRGLNGHAIPVYLLDTDCPENAEWDRRLTDFLYGGDQHYRLCQEAVLGIGGVKMLRRLGYTNIETFHMNEGHASLLALALLEELIGDDDLGSATKDDLDEVRRRCVFTTHTPVPAGHDQFPRSLMTQVLGKNRASVLDATSCCPDGTLNMTFLGLRLSRYINGVAMRHGEISRDMFPQYPVRAITNGVHAATWTAPAFQSLYDRHIPEWRHDNAYLRYVIGIDCEEINRAHLEAKRCLLATVKSARGITLDENRFTIGFARRAAAYKRFELLFSSPERLRHISENCGPLQVVYAGKAHPRDEAGKESIRRIFRYAAELNGPRLRIVYLEDYDMRLAKLLTSGVDLWLNTPQPPLEASGTSGMKAALNGVPSASVPDGWWIEGCLEGATGWAIGDDSGADDGPALYEKLAAITTLFYERPARYFEVMRAAIAINGSFFNTQRMLAQYVANAYVQHSSSAASG